MIHLEQPQLQPQPQANPLSRRRARRRVMEYLDFMCAFATKPLKTGAIMPSSRQLAEKMLQALDLGEGKVVVEVGPGTGAITRVILERLKDPTQYFGLELNADFVKLLGSRFPHAQVHHGSAEFLDQLIIRAGRPCADYVISGLPWTLFSESLQKRILTSITRSLAPNGVFTTFAYLQSRLLPSGLAFRNLLNETFPWVEETKIVWKNLPPAIIYRCRTANQAGQTGTMNAETLRSGPRL